MTTFASWLGLCQGTHHGCCLAHHGCCAVTSLLEVPMDPSLVVGALALVGLFLVVLACVW